MKRGQIEDEETSKQPEATRKTKTTSLQNNSKSSYKLAAKAGIIYRMPLHYIFKEFDCTMDEYYEGFP